jgi:hypothetical protein
MGQSGPFLVRKSLHREEPYFFGFPLPFGSAAVYYSLERKQFSSRFPRYVLYWLPSNPLKYVESKGFFFGRIHAHNPRRSLREVLFRHS